MSITSSRTVQVQFSGDNTQEFIQSALDNALAAGQVDFITLDIGSNPVFPPTNTAFVVAGVTIIPPAGNEEIITLKGAFSDTGIPIHLTDPTSIGLDSSFTGLNLVVAAEVVGVRLVWN